MGRVVQTPAEGGQAAGKHTASFDIRHSSLVIPTGVYSIRLTSSNCEKTRKVVIRPGSMRRMLQPLKPWARKTTADEKR